MSKDTDFPAFPIHGVCTAYQFTGLTARDYFAAKAMGFIMKGFMDAAAKEGVKTTNEQWVYMAEACYGVADAMLKAREA